MKTLSNLVILFFGTLTINAQVSVQTNLTPKIAPGADLVLEVKINKGAINNFSKYQIDVPAGVTISEGDTRSGNFTFDGGRAKIVWVSIPSEPEFIVSFKMKTGSASGPGVFNHKFYYLDNGGKQEVELEPVSVTFDPSGVSSLASLGGAAIASKPAEAKTNEPAVTNTPEAPKTEVVNTPPKEEPKNEIVNTPPKEEPKTEIAKTTPKEEPVKTPVKETPPVVENTPKTVSSENTGARTNSGGIVYKVQIGAYGEDPGKSKFASIGKVVVSKEGGFYKVLVGDYNSKDEAISRLNQLKGSGFNGFVVSYQNGVRIK